MKIVKPFAITSKPSDPGNRDIAAHPWNVLWRLYIEVVMVWRSLKPKALTSFLAVRLMFPLVMQALHWDFLLC